MASPRPTSSRKRKPGVTLDTLLSPLQHKATVKGENLNKKRKTTTPSGNSDQQCRSNKLFSDQDPMEEPMDVNQSSKKLAKCLDSFGICSKSVKELRKHCKKATASRQVLQQQAEKANDDYNEVKDQKEAASRRINTCEEHLSAYQQETMKLRKRIDAIAAQTETTKKKKAEAGDVAYDPNAIKHALRVRTAAEEKLEQIAKRIEDDKLIQMNSYDIPLMRTSKAYSRMLGEEIFVDIGLPFCHSTGMDLSQLQLKILRKGLKTYRFPAAHSMSQAN
jgi:chromosome segregation ATPase